MTLKVLMAPERAIDALLMVPYRAGRGDLAGADCFGVVELYYRMVFGIEVLDRAGHAPGHAGLEEGYRAARDWMAIDAPEDHCLVLMRAGLLQAGHIGVFYNGCVVHSDEAHGCACEPITDRFLRSRITGFLKRK